MNHASQASEAYPCCVSLDDPCRLAWGFTLSFHFPFERQTSGPDAAAGSGVCPHDGWDAAQQARQLGASLVSRRHTGLGISRLG